MFSSRARPHLYRFPWTLTHLILCLFTLQLSVESPAPPLHLFCAELIPKREDEMKCTEQPNREKTRKALLTTVTEKNSMNHMKWGYTYITADLLHISIHEKELGNILRGTLQQPVQQGNISTPQLLLFWNLQAMSWNTEHPTGAPSTSCSHEPLFLTQIPYWLKCNNHIPNRSLILSHLRYLPPQFPPILSGVPLIKIKSPFSWKSKSKLLWK